MKNWLLGHIDYSKEADFVPISLSYTKRKHLYLHKNAYKAFTQMHASAKKDGITLVILSASRSFRHQKMIWEKKWKRIKKERKIPPSQTVVMTKTLLRYSAMPTTSRHHWGTEVDLNALYNEYFTKGQGKSVYLWLQKNATRFGFCQVYTKKGSKRMHGYEEERWHWSYLPVARSLLKSYLKQISYKEIKGFLGDSLATNIRVIQNYVAGISSDCQ